MLHERQAGWCRQVDPNTNTQMLESDAIVEYLFDKYGDGKVRPPPSRESCSVPSCYVIAGHLLLVAHQQQGVPSPLMAT